MKSALLIGMVGISMANVVSVQAGETLLDKLTITGDLRLRHTVEWSSSAPYPDISDKLRLRLGLNTNVTEGLKASFGLATGQETISSNEVIDSDPATTDTSIANGFGKNTFMINYAFLEYVSVDWLKVTAGKMKSGTQVWNATDLLWDSDINPAGFALTFDKDIASAVHLFFNGSWLTFEEKKNTTSASAPAAYIVQPGIVAKVNTTLEVKAALACQAFAVQGKNLTYFGGLNNATNATVTPQFDYFCWNPSFIVAFKNLAGPFGLHFFGDYVQNTDGQVQSDNIGSNYGIRIGNESIGALGQWQVTYMLRRLEQNSWLNKMGDSSAYSGLVNAAGYQASAAIGLMKAASFIITYYNMNKIIGASSSTPQTLIQFDVVYKF